MVIIMTDISVQNIRHGFEVGDNVLDGLSFEIFEGEHVEPFSASSPAR